MIRDNIVLYKNYNNLNIHCYCCNYTNHIAKECPMVHVIINPQRVIRDHIKIEPTNRRQFPRFEKKFKALKHLGNMIRACIKLQRTTTLEMSTVTIEIDEDEEDDDQDQQDLSLMRPLSPFRKLGLNNKPLSYTKLRSKSSVKSLIPDDSSCDDKEKFYLSDKKIRNNKSQNTINLNTYNPGSVTTGFSGAFETYINNVGSIGDSERLSSAKLTFKMKKNTNSFVSIPKTHTSPKNKSQNFGENSGKYLEHQKMVAEALMLQGIASGTGAQEDYAKMSYNELLNQFDKMKNYEIYFPYNNVEIIVEFNKNLQKSLAMKRRKSRYRKKNSNSFSSPLEAFHNNFSTFYQQMSFKHFFKIETINTHNSNYEDLMYRRALTQNEGSPAKKLRLLPTKTFNFNKGISTLNANLRKCQTIKKKIAKNKCYGLCFFCKKKKGNEKLKS